MTEPYVGRRRKPDPTGEPRPPLPPDRRYPPGEPAQRPAGQGYRPSDQPRHPNERQHPPGQNYRPPPPPGNDPRAAGVYQVQPPPRRKLRAPAIVLTGAGVFIVLLAATIIIGLHLIPRSHPAADVTRPASAAASPSVPPLACSSISYLYEPMVRDMRKQTQLWGVANSAPVHLSRATEADMSAGVWTDPGSYSGALDGFLGAAGSITASTPSQPPQLSQAVAALLQAGSAVQSDVQNGGLSTGQPVQHDYATFQSSLATLAIDCGMKVPGSWLGG